MALFCKKKARPYVDLIVAYGWGVLQCCGAERPDWEFLVGLYLNIERVESRHSLRVLFAVQQAFERVPDYRLFAASVDDPQLATHLWERQKSLADLEEQRERKRGQSQVNGEMEVSL